ncbi:MAG: DUF599 domain-containing protein [Bauldia sp.]
MDLRNLAALDAIAMIAFAIAWAGYALIVDHGPLSRHTLSSAMNRERRTWIGLVQAREVRIADTNIIAGLQQGSAFFASTSALAIGGCLAILGSSDLVATVLDDLTPGYISTGVTFDVKVLGLIVIFVYAFFKFSWGYRLYNYASILLGALPPARDAGTPAADTAIEKTALFLALGSRNFNRGQRAFLFSLAYLGWLASPWFIIAGTLIVVIVLVHRQFFSAPAFAFNETVTAAPKSPPSPPG